MTPGRRLLCTIISRRSRWNETERMRASAGNWVLSTLAVAAAIARWVKVYVPEHVAVVVVDACVVGAFVPVDSRKRGVRVVGRTGFVIQIGPMGANPL